VGAVVIESKGWWVGTCELAKGAEVLHGGRRLSVVRWETMGEKAQDALPTSVWDPPQWIAVDDRNGPGYVPSGSWEDWVHLARVIIERNDALPPEEKVQS
jgi:hypothetical protein